MAWNPFWFVLPACPDARPDRAVPAHGFHPQVQDLFLLQRGEYPVQHPVLVPAVQTHADCVPGAEPLWPPAPRAPVCGNIEDRVAHLRMGNLDVTPWHGQVGGAMRFVLGFREFPRASPVGVGRVPLRRNPSIP